MRYFTVTPEELQAARPGIELMDRILDRDDDRSGPYLFGTTTKDTVLLAAEEVLADDVDQDAGETGPTLNEVAIAIPFSSDALYRLMGSGYQIKREDFAYRAGRDDVRSHWLSARDGVFVTLGDLETIGLANSDTWLDEFLKEYGVNTGAVEADITIPRTEPAVTRDTPLPAGSRAASKRAHTRPAPVYDGRNSIDNFLACE